MEPARLISGAVYELSEQEQMLREREARIRRASKRLKSQLAGVEDERRRLAQDRTKMAHASTTLRTERERLRESLNAADQSRDMAISKHQAHVDSVLTVQAQLAAAAAARGVHAAPLPPAAPSAPARSRLPPPDLSLRLRLNVGGQRFEVSQHVMLQDPTSLLAALCAVHNDAAGTPMPTLDDFTGENGQGLSAADMGTPHMLAITAALAATSLRPRIPPPSPDGSYFFERDWVMFRHLLNFLRDGRLPSRTSLLRDLYQEAIFFDVHSLQQEVEGEIARRFAALEKSRPSQHRAARASMHDVQGLLAAAVNAGAGAGAGAGDVSDEAKEGGPPQAAGGGEQHSSESSSVSPLDRARNWLLAGSGQSAAERRRRRRMRQTAVTHLAGSLGHFPPQPVPQGSALLGGGGGGLAASAGARSSLPAPQWGGGGPRESVLGPAYERARRALEDRLCKSVGKDEEPARQSRRAHRTSGARRTRDLSLSSSSSSSSSSDGSSSEREGERRGRRGAKPSRRKHGKDDSRRRKGRGTDREAQAQQPQQASKSRQRPSRGSGAARRYDSRPSGASDDNEDDVLFSGSDMSDDSLDRATRAARKLYSDLRVSRERKLSQGAKRGAAGDGAGSEGERTEEALLRSTGLVPVPGPRQRLRGTPSPPPEGEDEGEGATRRGKDRRRGAGSKPPPSGEARSKPRGKPAGGEDREATVRRPRPRSASRSGRQGSTGKRPGAPQRARGAQAGRRSP